MLIAVILDGYDTAKGEVEEVESSIADAGKFAWYYFGAPLVVFMAAVSSTSCCGKVGPMAAEADVFDSRDECDGHVLAKILVLSIDAAMTTSPSAAPGPGHQTTAKGKRQRLTVQSPQFQFY